MNNSDFSYKVKARLIGRKENQKKIKEENNLNFIKNKKIYIFSSLTLFFLSSLTAITYKNHETIVKEEEREEISNPSQGNNEILFSWEPLTNEQIIDIVPSNIQEQSIDELKTSKYYKAMKLLNSEQQLWTQRIAHQYKIDNSAAAYIVTEAVEAGTKHGIDPRLLLSIIAVESSFNPYAKSSAGAIGLVQVLPKAHKDKIAVINEHGEHPIETTSNITLGAEILAEYLRWKKGSVRGALQQYNGTTQDRRMTYSNKVSNTYRKIFLKPMPERIYPTKNVD